MESGPEGQRGQLLHFGERGGDAAREQVVVDTPAAGTGTPEWKRVSVLECMYAENGKSRSALQGACFKEYCTVLYGTVQYQVQYSAAQYITVQYSTVLYSQVHELLQLADFRRDLARERYRTVLYIQYCAVQHSTVQYSQVHELLQLADLRRDLARELVGIEGPGSKAQGSRKGGGRHQSLCHWMQPPAQPQGQQVRNGGGSRRAGEEGENGWGQKG